MIYTFLVLGWNTKVNFGLFFSPWAWEEKEQLYPSFPWGPWARQQVKVKAGIAQVNVMLPEEQVHSAQWARSSQSRLSCLWPTCELSLPPSLPPSLRTNLFLGKKKKRFCLWYFSISKVYGIVDFRVGKPERELQFCSLLAMCSRAGY